MSNIIKKALDGIQNVITGLNSKTKDKRVNIIAVPDLLNCRDSEDLYSADSTARKIVDKIPKEGTRKWIEITNADPNIKTKFDDEFERLKAQKKLRKAWSLARLYGGAVIYVSIDDGEDPSLPINFNKATTIKALIVLHRYEITPETQTIDKDIDSTNFGYPTHYRIISASSNSNLIHHERILRFDGAELPPKLFIKNGYWHDSILSALKSPIINYSQSHDMLASIFQDFRQRVLKIDQFAQMVAADEDDLLIKRMEIQDLIRSNFKTDMIDKEDELEIVSTPLTGIKDTVTMINNRLAESSSFPHTIILGESPKGGLSDKGDSQNQDWYDLVSEEQEDVLKEPLTTLIQYLMKTKKGPTNGTAIPALGFEFLPLKRVNDTERAKMELDVAKKDEVYIQNQVLTPDEVAISRFGGEKYSMDTTLESGDRSKFLEPEQTKEEPEVTHHGIDR